MSVTNYQPKNDLGCRYAYDKLDNVVYLVSVSHLKNVHIDNGEAYITNLTEAPLKLDCFNIQFNEETSLDERYKFTKTLKFSMYGYVPHTYFNDKFYAIIKSKDGTLWMLNVDFPSYVTYTFNLGNNVYETDFTFSTVSNFPTLRLASDITQSAKPCVGFRANGVKSLKLLEREYCNLDFDDNRVYTYQGEEFKVVEYLGESCTLQENFDGMKTTTTINFDIAFDAYKSSWHYNLLEFLQNLYAAIVEPKGSDNTFFCGFGFGLEPSFTVSTTSQNGESDTITVTLTDASTRGLHGASAYTQTGDTTVLWTYVDYASGYQAYECVGNGQAKYLLQQELSSNGVPTGRYKALEGYENNFPNLNIIGTFSNIQIYSNSNCVVSVCSSVSDIPLTITYYEQTCYTYSYSASCDWSVSNLPSYVTVSPMYGVANSAYTLTVCNTKTPTENESGTFKIVSGDSTKIVNVNLRVTSSGINPTAATINCLSQDVTFTFNSSCPYSVVNYDSSKLSYIKTNSQLIFTVPRNYSTESSITWAITVKDCNDNQAQIYIIQDKTYERWIDTTDYLCDGGNSYTKQLRYTGTTSTNINTQTSEYRKGSLIQNQDPRCGSSQTRWVWDNNYYCVDGNKYKAEEEEISYDNGQTWTKTGATRLGELVEESSSWCEGTVEYKWVLTTQWQCQST